MKKKLIVLSGFVLSLSPVVVFAADPIILCSTGESTKTVGSLFSLFCRLGQIFGAVLPVLIALAVLLFVVGVVFYVIASDEAAKKKGRDRMIYGIVGLAVIIALWGLVTILTNTFGLSSPDSAITLPVFNF